MAILDYWEYPGLLPKNIGLKYIHDKRNEFDTLAENLSTLLDALNMNRVPGADLEDCIVRTAYIRETENGLLETYAEWRDKKYSGYCVDICYIGKMSSDTCKRFKEYEKKDVFRIKEQVMKATVSTQYSPKDCNNLEYKINILLLPLKTPKHLGMFNTRIIVDGDVFLNRCVVMD